MLIQFLRGVPRDMEEAAQIDGCNSIQVLWYVVVPILKPAIISVALFQFMWSSMNDFIGPLIYVYSVDKYPIALALKMSIDVTEAARLRNEILAMASISILPSIIVFFFRTTLLRTGRYQQRNQRLRGNIMAEVIFNKLEKPDIQRLQSGTCYRPGKSRTASLW